MAIGLRRLERVTAGDGCAAPRLHGADFRGADLVSANLIGANLIGADFRGADLFGANLITADLRDANLRDADLRDANLSHGNLCDARLIHANLREANLSGANLRDANLATAKLEGAKLRATQLDGAQLCGTFLTNADLSGANLCGAILRSTDLDSACLAHVRALGTAFTHLDLTKVRGLETIVHSGPSPICTSTLVKSKGRIPAEFLRGCGLQPWEVEAAKLYDPALTPEQVNDIQYKIFELRTGPMFLGGIFISYSHDDAKFVDKLHAKLMEDGANVWLDRHSMVAGDLEKQIDRAIRLNDVVVLALSESSVDSDWVEHELEKARKKEKDEGRDVLCPVALDDAWKAKLDDVLWRHVKKKNVLDFSKWKSKAFDAPYQKLIKGLRVNYPRNDDSPSANPPMADS